MDTNNKWNQFTGNSTYSQDTISGGTMSPLEAKRKALSILGDGTNCDGQTREISVGGYNFTCVNKGGVWKISVTQKVA